MFKKNFLLFILLILIIRSSRKLLNERHPLEQFYLLLFGHLLGCSLLIWRHIIHLTATALRGLSRLLWGGGGRGGGGGGCSSRRRREEVVQARYCVVIIGQGRGQIGGEWSRMVLQMMWQVERAIRLIQVNVAI